MEKVTLTRQAAQRMQNQVLRSERAPAPLQPVKGSRRPRLTARPPVYEATADESDGEITAKRIDSNGDFVGDEITFTVLPD